MHLLFCFIAALLDTTGPVPVQNIKESFKNNLLGGSWDKAFSLDVTKLKQPSADIRARPLNDASVQTLIKSINNRGVDQDLAGTVVVFEDAFKGHENLFLGFRDALPSQAPLNSIDWTAFYSANPMVIEGSHRLAALQQLYSSSVHKQSYNFFSFRILVMKTRSVDVVNKLVEFGVSVNRTDEVRSNMTDVDVITSMHEKLLLKYPNDDPKNQMIIGIPHGKGTTEQELMKVLFGFRELKGNAFFHIFLLARWKGELWDAFLSAVRGPSSLIKGLWYPLANTKNLYDALSNPGLTNSMRITILNQVAAGKLGWKQVKTKVNSLHHHVGLQSMVAHFFHMSFSEVVSKFPESEFNSSEYLLRFVDVYQKIEAEEKAKAQAEKRKMSPISEWKMPEELKNKCEQLKSQQQIVSYILVHVIFVSSFVLF